VCEYGLAVLLVLSSVHVAHGGLLAAGGVAFGLLAATGPGPTGVVRVCPPRLHAALDVAVCATLAAAPLVPALRPDLAGILLVEFTAVGWLRVTTLTAFRRRPRPGAGPTTGTAPAPGGALQPAIDAGARRLGKGAARARRVWRRDGPAT